VEHLCEVGIDCAVAVGFGRLELFAGTDLSYDVDVALVRFYLAYLVGMAGGLGVFANFTTGLANFTTVFTDL